MGEAFVKELLSLCLQRVALDQTTNSDFEFIQVVRNFESVRQKWLQAEMELKKYKELLVKSDVARGALEVKLKHARNQVDVEIKKRYKVEADYQYLERQMLLMGDILMRDGRSNTCLNEEQRSVLANFKHSAAVSTQRKSRRLSVIDESSFLSHSDISYDRTDDDLDLDSTAVLKPLKSRAREKRRSSMGPSVGSLVHKRGRLSGHSGDLLPARHMDKEMEGTVVTACVTTPDSGSQIHMVIDITQETTELLPQIRLDQGPPATAQSQRDLAPCSTPPCPADQTSVWVSAETSEAELVPEMEVTIEPCLPPKSTPTVDKALQHVFVPKTVIRPETCTTCKKRIRFGKIAVKCQDCRVVAHPECKHLCSESCSPVTHGSLYPNENTLESFTPSTLPRIPALVVQCVNEVERRGLQERGVYRVPGSERLVKELRERYISGKAPLMLHKVNEIHVVCGLLKDFLRKLKEPLITFQLHRTFMEAVELADDDGSCAVMMQAVGRLPRCNRDTLAFLMLHLQRVMQSAPCQMDQNNLARVFGPTIVGHSIPEPSPLTIMRDTNTQPKVVSRLLSFHSDYWRSLMNMEGDQVISSVIKDKTSSISPGAERDRIFKPVTSPELSKYPSAPGSASLKGRIKNLGSAFNNPSKSRNEVGKKFFTSPK